ncbi:MAG: FAD-dependent monooxygenase [Gammaproteobacteria bacterium]|nr:FAD-dependent monooxygenase [Gammaproteobacteria bacterium]
MSAERVVILGAGLAGSLLAIYLARRGFSVDVYEGRPDLRTTEIPAGRSINLALANRGIRALTEVGLYKSVRELLITMRGRMLHEAGRAEAFQPYGKNDDEVIYSVSRGGLNELLLNTAQHQYGVRFHFDQRVMAANMRSGEVRLRDSDGRQYVIDQQPLIAADGAGSIVRRQMSKLPGYHAREDYLPHAYKELSIAPTADGGHAIDANSLHIWPRGDYMLIALPNLDGSFTVTLFLARHGHPGFDTLSTPAELNQFFKAQFPDVLELIPDLEDQFFANPVGVMGTVYCAPWRVGGKFLLVGDAAHSIVPFHGQGMNCAFEDCYELDRCIESNQYAGPRGWERVFARFEANRKANTDAIAAMALENYVEMRDSVRDPRFHLKKKLAWELERRFPDTFVPRYSLVMFHHVPYAEAQRRGIIQQEILEQLLGPSSNLEDVDYDQAEKLIKQRLAPAAETTLS